MGKKGTKRKTRWRVLPIGEDGGSGSGNEEEADCDTGGGGGSTGSYARATQQRMLRRPGPNQRAGNPGPGGYYNKQQQYHHHSRSYNHHDNNQPLVTTEKQIFNEEEYTKITTPRQDVLFKKGYLGRKRPVAVVTESSDQTTADVANGNGLHYDPAAMHNEDGLDNDPNEMVEEHPQFIYTNGFVDQSGIYYINGSGYEMYDPYTGHVTVLVGPHYGPNGGPPVLAAVPCQPVPLQPLEWFNPPGFLPYVTAPCQNGLARDRRKRYSTDSQNCSPQSSESTGPPGSPQESDEMALNGGGEGVMYHPHHPPPPPYVYPGYMFGAPMYNMNGVTVQSTPNEAPSSDVSGKRRKKKRRRRRRRNGVEDGSEESSSEDKEPEEEPMSVTSQESSLESDSKLSTAGEGGDPKPRPPSVDSQPPPDADVAEVVTKTNVQTQTVVEKQEVVETYQQPNPVSDVDKRHVNDAVHVDSKVVKSLAQEAKKEKKIALVNGSNCVDVKEVKEVVNEIVSQPKLNGGLVNGKGLSKAGIVTGEKLVNGHDVKPKGEKKTEKKGKKVNGLTNGIVEKAQVVVEKRIEETEGSFYEDDGFVCTQEFINGNVTVELDEESGWVTVKGHKGSQGKRSDSARVGEEKKFPSELTNGHVKSNRDGGGHKVNGVGGKEKAFHKNNSTDRYKGDKSLVNGTVEEKCTYTKVKQNESGNKEKTVVNGKGKHVNGNKMDGNEKENPSRGREMEAGNGDAREASSSEMSASPDVPKKSIQHVDEPTPVKPSRKERKSLKNGSPPKTPEFTLTATAKPFEMPSVSLRPQTFVKQAESSLSPSYLSREDSLLAALTVIPPEAKSMEDIAKDIKSSLQNVLACSSKDVTKVTEVAKNAISGAEQKQKSRDEPKGGSVTSKVSPLKDLASKTIGQEQFPAGFRQDARNVLQFTSLKDSSKAFLVTESQNVGKEESKGVKAEEFSLGSRVSSGEKKSEGGQVVEKRKEIGEGDSDSEVTPPVPPPRKKKLRQGNKRVVERVTDPGKTNESTDESSSSSSQESEESVIECLSSGFNSPKAKVVASLSDEEEEIIFQGKLGEKDPQPLGRISESQEEPIAALNGKSSTRNNGTKIAPPQPKATTSKVVPKEKAKSPVPQKSVQISIFEDTKDTFSDIYKSEEHLKSVQKMAQEIVDSVIDEAMQESVRLKNQKDSDPPKLGITDAVTRWLRSQSPDVLSLPINDFSDSEVSEDLEEDIEEMTTGSKNLKSNPLPAPSVKDNNSQLNSDDLIGDNGMGRRVANKSSEKKDLKDSRNDTPDLEDDAMSNGSLPSGEWDLWDCQQTIIQNYDKILDKPHNSIQTKSTNEINIISPEMTRTNSPNLNDKSIPLVLEYLNLSDGKFKYDPLANDTFSPVENTLMSELIDPAGFVHDRCTSMCDPALSVAKYYILGTNLQRPFSRVDDLDCSDSDDSSLTKHDDNGGDTYRMSLAEELARLDQPLPASWAVEPIRIEEATKQRRCVTCHCNGQDCGAPVDSGVESGDEATVFRKREGVSVFKRKLVGRLKGEGTPFPCGGICCILQ